MKDVFSFWSAHVCTNEELNLNFPHKVSADGTSILLIAYLYILDKSCSLSDHGSAVAKAHPIPPLFSTILSLCSKNSFSLS